MKKRFALYGMFAAMAIFATACGDDSSSGPDEEESSSSIEAEDESSSSVEEEGKSSAKEEGKSSSSEAKKGDSSSSEKAASSSSEAGNSSSSISYEPTCTTIKTEGSIVTVEAHIYASDMGGDVGQIIEVDYDNYTVRSTQEFSTLGVTSCEEAETMLEEQMKSCSAEDKTVVIVSTPPEGYFGTLANAEEAICEKVFSGFVVDTTALNQDMLAAGEYGTFRDTRDAMLYRTIKIGNQTWMAQNLMYVTESGSVSDGNYYTWETATGACPTGWDLPTKADFEELILLVDEEYNIEDDNSEFDFEKAKDLVSKTWNDISGNDPYGFSVVAAGYRDDFGSHDVGESATFWTKTSSSGGKYVFGISSEFAYAGMMFSSDDGSSKKTVRCIKKDSAPAQSISSN